MHQRFNTATKDGPAGRALAVSDLSAIGKAVTVLPAPTMGRDRRGKSRAREDRPVSAMKAQHFPGPNADRSLNRSADL